MKLMYCGRCGGAIPENASFCQKCGAPVKRLNYETPIAQPNYETPIAQSNYGQTVVQPDYSQIRPKKSKKPLIIGLVSLLLIIGVVVLVIVKPWNTPKGVVKDFFDFVSEKNEKRVLDTLYPMYLYGESKSEIYYDIVEDVFGGTAPYDIQMRDYTVDSESKLDKSQVDYYNSKLMNRNGYKKISEAYEVCGTFTFYDAEEKCTWHAQYEFTVVKCGSRYYLIDYVVDM